MYQTKSGRYVMTLTASFYVFYLVYTTQVNSAFRPRWLASSEVISQVLFTSEQPKKNKMTSRFK